MSSVSPGAFVTTSERYLPRPSWVMPRLTVIPVFGTSANLIVSFGCAHIASARSLPTLSVGDVERGRELDVGDVVAAEVHVHQAGDELVVRRVLVVLHALEERVGAVADADDRDADLVLASAPCRWSSRCSSRWSKPWCPFDWIAKGISSASESVSEHEVVDVELAAPRRGLELAAELGRHAQHDGAGRAGDRLPAAAAGGERNAEALREERDGDVVQVRLAAGDLADEGALERAGHADEHARPLGERSASSQTASTLAQHR